MALRSMYRSRNKGQKSYKIKRAGDPKNMLTFWGGELRFRDFVSLDNFGHIFGSSTSGPTF